MVCSNSNKPQKKNKSAFGEAKHSVTNGQQSWWVVSSPTTAFRHSIEMTQRLSQGKNVVSELFDSTQCMSSV